MQLTKKDFVEILKSELPHVLQEYGVLSKKDMPELLQEYGVLSKKDMPELLQKYGVLSKKDMPELLQDYGVTTKKDLTKLERSLTLKITKSKNDLANRIANVAVAKAERSKVEKIDARVTTLENYQFS